MKYEELKDTYNSKVYVIQELPGTRSGTPKFNKFRKFFWTLFSKNVHVVTCPTQSTLKKLDARPSENKTNIIAEKWKPFRGSAALLLWHYYSKKK